MKKYFIIAVLMGFTPHVCAVEPVTIASGVIIASYLIKAGKSIWGKKEVDPKDDPRVQAKLVAEKEVDKLQKSLEQTQEEMSLLRKQLEEGINKNKSLNDENVELKANLQKRTEELITHKEMNAQSRSMYLCIYACLNNASE